MLSENIDEAGWLGEPSVGKEPATDRELLREYAATGSNVAFAEIVARHMNWVYAAALRQCGNHAVAQDITQAVFIILARKASSLRRESVLSGWLFRAVRYAVLDAHKLEARRQNREQEAARMELTDSASENDRAWEQMAPVLDAALAELGAKDRHAVLLRFFEKKSFGEIGAVLGGNENSARVRVVRALEKLRGHFRRRGVVLSAVVIGGVLLGQAAQAAPPQLMASLAGAAGTAAASGTAALLVQAVLRRLFWRRIRVVTGIAIGLLLMLLCLGVFWRQWQAGRAARRVTEQAATARALREVMIGIDRAYWFNHPNEFVALIHFRNSEDGQFRSLLGEYVRAESSFRQEMKQAFNVQQRAFNATFNELCVGQPPVLKPYIGSERVATNIMMAKYPLHLVKVGGTWKWDLFGGFSREGRDQRMAVLARKAQLLENLSHQIRDGIVTNVTEILQAVEGTEP
jgi:RNA polymerase sigma factor (sigma-70 family)